jgi:hypothetical protein
LMCCRTPTFPIPSLNLRPSAKFADKANGMDSDKSLSEKSDARTSGRRRPAPNPNFPTVSQQFFSFIRREIAKDCRCADDDNFLVFRGRVLSELAAAAGTDSSGVPSPPCFPHQPEESRLNRILNLKLNVLSRA